MLDKIQYTQLFLSEGGMKEHEVAGKAEKTVRNDTGSDFSFPGSLEEDPETRYTNSKTPLVYSGMQI